MPIPLKTTNTKRLRNGLYALIQMWIRRLFSFEWALILKSINVARTAADIFYSFPIDCTFLYERIFVLNSSKWISEREDLDLSRIFRIYHLKSLIHICKASCFEQQNLLIYITALLLLLLFMLLCSCLYNFPSMENLHSLRFSIHNFL